MALTTSEMSAADLAAVVGNSNGNGNNNGWGDNGLEWLILLFLFAFGNNGNGWGNGFGGVNNGGGGGAVPYIGVTSDVQRGFDQSAIMASLNGLTTGQCNQTATLQNAITQGQMANMQGFNALQNQLCNCCNDMGNTVQNGFFNAETAAANRQMANMQSVFGLQTALNSGVNTLQNTMMSNEMARQQCCCDTKQAIGDLKYTVATENCADRAAVSDGIRDVIANQTGNTTALLNTINSGIQSIKDQLCADKIESKNETISQLRSQLNEANRLASQTLQTAQIRDGQMVTMNNLVNELRSCPIPSMPVYGIQPIFTCQNKNQGCGCGCGCGVA